MADVIGGATLPPTTATALPSSLPYPSTAGTPFVLDNTYRPTLRVQFSGIDQILSADAIYGKRLTLFFDGSGTPQLRLDGTAVGGAGTAVPVLAITHKSARQRPAFAKPKFLNNRNRL